MNGHHAKGAHADGAHADVSVRPAVAGDEHEVARIQLAAWRSAHAATLGQEVLESFDEGAFVERWAQAVRMPPAPGYRVLVACAGPRVVGFAAVAPVPPPEEEPLAAPGGVILALEVDPPEQRAGHGSRLLAAAVDLLRGDGADQVQTWVIDGDEARDRFLAGAGMGPDGAVRDLSSGAGPGGETFVVRERRWYASI